MFSCTSQVPSDDRPSYRKSLAQPPYFPSATAQSTSSALKPTMNMTIATAAQCTCLYLASGSGGTKGPCSTWRLVLYSQRRQRWSVGGCR